MEGKHLIDQWESIAPLATDKYKEHTKNSRYLVRIGNAEIPCDDLTGELLTLKNAVIPWGNYTYVYDEIKIAEGCIIFPMEEKGEPSE